ncbi:hypothetical protein [Actinokineospora sp. HUAS TT18]|uniref:hypothetical protein n=1 Tax=Actinokineospora sp. HUAS TT18 TaxID=3447451 RepID=UPI003F526184
MTDIRISGRTVHPALADQFAPIYHTRTVATTIVDADPHTTYQAARHFDLTQAHSRVLDTLVWVRGLPSRLRRRGRPRVPTRLTLDDLAVGSTWTVLGERPDEEFALGLVASFWRPIPRVREVAADDFAQFVEPRFGKLVVHVITLPFAGRTLLMVEKRVVLPGDAGRRAFRWYWLTVRPFAAVVERVLLRSVRQAAESASTKPLEEQA